MIIYCSESIESGEPYKLIFDKSQLNAKPEKQSNGSTKGRVGHVAPRLFVNISYSHDCLELLSLSLFVLFLDVSMRCYFYDWFFTLQINLTLWINLTLLD